jgi:hypothetical protein
MSESNFILSATIETRLNCDIPHEVRLWTPPNNYRRVELTELMKKSAAADSGDGEQKKKEKKEQELERFLELKKLISIEIQNLKVKSRK